MSAVSIGGDLVHYEVLGRGRSVVLLHGWIGSWRYWVPSMQQLHLKYKVYALDLFGFGDSAKNPRRYGFDEQVRMVLEFLHALQLRKVALVGHGLGAWVAVELARRAPETVARMMLISTPLFAPPGLNSRQAPAASAAPTPPIDRTANDAAKTIYNADEFRKDAPLASLGRGGYDDKPISRPRQPKIAEPGDPTLPNVRLINRARLEEAAKAARSRTIIPGIMTQNEDNPLYKLLLNQEPAVLLNRTMRKTDQQFDRLAQDVSRTDTRVLTQTATYYDAGSILDGLRVLPMPVMMVHGVADPLITPPDEAVWGYLTSEKEDLCVPVPLPAGHFPMYEYDSFPRMLTSFLDAPDISKMEIKERWRRRSR